MRRDPSPRWLDLRIRLFFLAAAIWVAGVVLELSAVRWAALAIGIGGLILGLAARRHGPPEPPPDEES